MIVASKSRPSWISLNRYAEGAEAETFKMHFGDWEESSIHIARPASKERVKVDVAALCIQSIQNDVEPLVVDSAMQLINSFLESFSCFVFQRGKFVALPDEERGHFFMKDAYAFLCVYRATAHQLKELLSWRLESRQLPSLLGENDGSKESTDLACVVYFCQSSRTSKLPYSNFKMTTQKEMEELVLSMYKCPLEVRLVEYGLEPFALLAHLENSYVLHSGSRLEKNQVRGRGGPLSLYQIRTDSRFETTRSVQIDLSSPLVSRDCFFVLDRTFENHLLWRGNSYDVSLLELAVESVIKITNSYLFKCVDAILEENEDEVESDNGWLMLPDNVRLSSGQDSSDLSECFGVSEIPILDIPEDMPILFTCGCGPGYFQIERPEFYTQRHLLPDSCAILDPGSEYPVYVWIGQSASDIVKKLVLKSAMLWLRNCQDGRFMGSEAAGPESLVDDLLYAPDSNDGIMSKIVWVEQGKEPTNFKAFFQAWDDKRLQLVEPGNLFSREHGSLSSPMLFSQ